MTIHTTEFQPEEGLLVLSSNGYQQVTTAANSNLLFKSTKQMDFFVTDRFKIDTAWETGNIFRIESGNLYKTEYDGTILYQRSFSTPESLSVSQKELVIPHDTNEFSDEYGCWVVDSSDRSLSLLDSSLSLVKKVEYFLSPVRVISSDFDHGCFVFDDGQKWVIKFNSSCEGIGMHTYLELFDPAMSTIEDVTAMFVDTTGSLWTLYDNIITKHIYSNGNFSSKITIDPLTDLGYDPSTNIVSDMCIDRTTNPNSIFVTGGCGGSVWILQYSALNVLLAYRKNIDIPHPTIIATPQIYGSDSLYMVTESDENYLPDVCFSSSSSSSSSG